jgi:hypothetical protein
MMTDVHGRTLRSLAQPSIGEILSRYVRQTNIDQFRYLSIITSWRKAQKMIPQHNPASVLRSVGYQHGQTKYSGEHLKLL